MQINYRPALELAQQKLREMDPRAVAERSGAELLAASCRPDANLVGMHGRSHEASELVSDATSFARSTSEFRLRLLARELRVPLAEMLVRDASSGEEAGVSPTLVTLHYLATADGTRAHGEWIPFRNLPGGNVYEHAFRRQCLQPLAASFGSDRGSLRTSAQSLDGEPLPMGDAAFRFQALPRLPMACVLWLGDDEQDAEANILFDASAPHYLPTEDLAALGRMLAFALIRAGGRKA